MSIRNIFDRICSFENILQAEKDTSRGKRYSSEVLKFWSDYEANLHSISEAIRSLELPPDEYRYFYIYEPKLRKVIYADYTTKIIQRAIYNVLNPLICKGFITDTYSCIEGRGQLRAMQRLSGWIDHVNKTRNGRWYYLKLDVEKFFYRIDHGVLMQILERKIGDKRTICLLGHYIGHSSRPFGLPEGVKSPAEISDEEMLWDKGIAIGGGLSHMYGNMYLDPLDQLMKRQERVKYYIRYMDDIVILSDSKEELHRHQRTVTEYLRDELHLRLNERTAIRPADHGVEFVGYRIKPGNVRLRKSTSLRMKHRIRYMQEEYSKGSMTVREIWPALMSYKAMMRHCNCRALDRKIFDDFVLRR